MTYVVLALIVALALGWGVFALIVQPSNDRNWAPEQARLATAHFDGDRVRVHNVRNIHYRSLSDADLHWETREYVISELESAWFVVAPFAHWRGMAHTFLSFGFLDGRYLAVSAEIRKQRGQAYSPIMGLLRQYELMLVVADERDLIALRAVHRRNDVYLYRLKATPRQAQSLFTGLLTKANALAERPTFYNTLTANCTSTIIDAVSKLAPGALPRSWRTLLPGYSDDLAYDLGLIDTSLSRETYRDAHRIPTLVEAAADAVDFSAHIRIGLAPVR